MQDGPDGVAKGILEQRTLLLTSHEQAASNSREKKKVSPPSACSVPTCPSLQDHWLHCGAPCANCVAAFPRSCASNCVPMYSCKDQLLSPAWTPAVTSPTGFHRKHYCSPAGCPNPSLLHWTIPGFVVLFTSVVLCP